MPMIISIKGFYLQLPKATIFILKAGRYLTAYHTNGYSSIEGDL